MAHGTHLSLVTFQGEASFLTWWGWACCMGQMCGTQPLAAYFLSLVASFSQHCVLHFGLDWPNTKPFPKQCLSFLEFGDTLLDQWFSKIWSADHSISIWVFVREASFGACSQSPGSETLGVGSSVLCVNKLSRGFWCTLMFECLVLDCLVALCEARLGHFTSSSPCACPREKFLSGVSFYSISTSLLLKSINRAPFFLHLNSLG